MSDKKEEQEQETKPIIIRNSTDLQRLKLEKLMKHPDKPVIIPERPKERGFPVVPDFVRNVMGSSAGAGSGEFHVYRHLRRKEYARQRFMTEKAERQRLNTEYQDKLEENKRIAAAKTAKRRRKREKRKKNKKKPKAESKSSPSDKTEESSEDESSEKNMKTSTIIENENTTNTELSEEVPHDKTDEICSKSTEECDEISK